MRIIIKQNTIHAIKIMRTVQTLHRNTYGVTQWKHE